MNQHNNMDCNIFPVAFGGYIKKENEFILDNVVDSAYSVKQFKNWYGCSKEYLSPGEKVSDPNNYADSSAPTPQITFCFSV